MRLVLEVGDWTEQVYTHCEPKFLSDICFLFATMAPCSTYSCTVTAYVDYAIGAVSNRNNWIMLLCKARKEIVHATHREKQRQKSKKNKQ